MSKIKKAFEVVEMKGKRTKLTYSYEMVKNKNGKEVHQRVEKKVEVPAGWMVYLPSGASLHVCSIEEMNRLGYARGDRVLQSNLIDVETGEPIDVDNTSLVRRAERIEEASKEKSAFRNSELGLE